MQRFLLQVGLCLMMIIAFDGCATIIGKGGAEQVNIRSTPDQAIIKIMDESGISIFEGKTPTIVSLEKKKGFFSGKTYTLSISKEGYSDKTVTIDTKANGWYIAGNLVFGGLIGWLIVDPATGAMWTLNTNDVNLTLESKTQGSLTMPNGRSIVLLQDVPNSLRSKMVKITD